MKIIHKDFKEGKIKLKIGTLDDLWYLKSIIEKGDILEGISFRRVKDEEKKRADRGEKVKMYLGIKVSNVDFSGYGFLLRVTGTIEFGPEDLVSFGSHHTIDVKVGSIVTIKKEVWKKWHLERLREAEKEGGAPILIIAAIEDGEAEFGIVRRYGVDFVARVLGPTSGKRYAKQQESMIKKFYIDVAEKIQELVQREKPEAVIIAGPGFWKENLLKVINEKFSKISDKCFLENIGSGGKSGIYEVLKRGVAERIAKNCRIARESQLVEKLLGEIGKDRGKAAYGLKEVEKALEYGAVVILLLSEKFVKEYEMSDKIIEKAKASKSEVMILSSEHEAGERLEAIGKIAAILRFPLSF